MPRPLVLVPARWAGVIEGRERPGVFAPRTLVDAITRAGGEPLLAWPDSVERARELVARADAVVLQGGDDLDLRPFGVPDVHPRETYPPPEQDAADVAVTRAALEAGVPVLAICRGMQVLNIVLGGTIHQHYEETSVAHADNPHDVDVVPGTLLERVMGQGRTGGVRLGGWSNHHQACDRLADGYLLSATTPDGCVEAMESTDGRVLAVQWHPEVDAMTVPHQQALFDWVVGEAVARTAQSG
ncbi:MAG: gamma-glutamyl-gamma-aminobutyrate hydrolase family protein [Pedococcus sp.]